MHTKFKIFSDWLPGPVPVMFIKDVPEPVELTGNRLEDERAAARGGMFQNSVRKNVIGPAIPPDVTPEEMTALIRNWVDEGNHFLKPLTVAGLDLQKAIGELPPLQDGYETNVVNCIKAALETAK